MAYQGPALTLATQVQRMGFRGLVTWPAVVALLRTTFDGASGTKRAAVIAFSIRVAGAGVALLTQVLLARWLGTYEFGIYAYVWTWVILLGSLIDFGFATTAQRFIPEYTGHKAFNLLRGFLTGSRWIVVAISTALAGAAALVIHFTEPWVNHFVVLPLYLGCITLPLYGLTMVQDGIARSYNWINLALMPLYIVRPIAIVVLMGAAHFAGFSTSAVTAVTASIVATWATAIMQTFMLDRRLKTVVEPGPKSYALRPWLATSLPVFMVGSFYFLLTYIDVLVLEVFRPPNEVAVYFAATKVLALVAFIYFSVWAVAARKFSEFHVAGDRERLAEFLAASIRWTFWPSLAATVVLLVFGRPILWLFGPEFLQGYWLLPLLAAGLLARASVGPAERLLNMLGEQRVCAFVYAGAFALNLIGCFMLIPHFGMVGAAISTSTALFAESLTLFLVTRYRLGLHVFIIGRPCSRAAGTRA